MYQADDKCPNCRATNLVRVNDLGEYKAGECFNCRFDRGESLPDEQGKENTANLPEGVTALPGGWYVLPDGSKVRKAKLQELYPDWQ